MQILESTHFYLNVINSWKKSKRIMDSHCLKILHIIKNKKWINNLNYNSENIFRLSVEFVIVYKKMKILINNKLNVTLNIKHKSATVRNISKKFN